MITQIVQLNRCREAEISAPLGYVFNSTSGTKFLNVSFGNEFFWKRYFIWKLVEKLNDNMIVEHICHIPPKEDVVLPLYSRYLPNKSARAFTQTYTESLHTAIENMDSENMIATDTPIAGVIFPVVVQNTEIDPRLKDILHDWIKNNPDVNLIAPIHTFFGSPISDISIYNYYIPIVTVKKDMVDDTLENSQWYNHGVMRTGCDMDIVADEMVDLLSNVYDDVRTNHQEPELLSDVLVDTFAPWKRYTYIDRQSSVYHLGSRLDFIKGKMSKKQLMTYMSPHMVKNNPLFDSPDFISAPIVGDINVKQFFCIPEFSKEFATLIEFLQEINMTDFCFRFMIEHLKNEYYKPEIVYVFHRYYPHQKFSRYFIPEIDGATLPLGPNDNLEIVFSDFAVKLGEHLVDWLVVQDKDLCLHYQYVSIIRTYNEELFIYFNNGDKFEDAEVYYYDIIAGTMCGRHTCNAKYQ